MRCRELDIFNLRLFEKLFGNCWEFFGDFFDFFKKIFGNFLGEIFWEVLFGEDFLEEFFWRNSLFALELVCLPRFCFCQDFVSRQ